jgi:hypothetical protein
MKVRVLPVEEGLEPKFRIIAETVEDEIFLKQLAGMYGDGSVSLQDVIFNGDGVSSLVIIGEALPIPSPPSGNGSTPITLPDYINISHLDPIKPQTISDGERVIWGGYVWENQAGGSVTPTIVDEFDLTGVVKLPRVVGDGYITFNAYVETGGDFGEPNTITRVRLPIANQLFEISLSAQLGGAIDPYTTMLGYVSMGNSTVGLEKDFTENYAIISNNLANMSQIKDSDVRRNGGGGNLFRVSDFARIYENNVEGNIIGIKGGWLIDSNDIGSNGAISNLFSSGRNSFIQRNVVVGSIDGIEAGSSRSTVNDNQITNVDAAIVSCQINNSRINENILSGASVEVGASGANIGWCKLNDNCEIVGNILSGGFSVIWDVNALENSKLNDNVLSGQGTRISAIQQQDFDELNGNELTGSGALISVINMIGNNQLNGNVVGGGTGISEIQMRGSKIIDNSFSDGTGTGIFRGEMKGAQIKNATNIRIERFDIAGIIWDLIGHTTDIIGHFYSNGKGNFTVKLGTTLAPGVIRSIADLTEDTDLFFNLIPTGHRVSRVYAKGESITASSGGVTIEIGAGSEAIKAPTLAQLNAADGTIEPNGGSWDIGVLQTSNVPLRLTAKGGDITGGELTVTVEYIKAD